MAEYSILTKHLADPDLEEININGWDDVALTHLDGRIEKAEEHFFSPQHAIDVVKKLLHHSGMIIDNAAPKKQSKHSTALILSRRNPRKAFRHFITLRSKLRTLVMNRKPIMPEVSFKTRKNVSREWRWWELIKSDDGV